MVELTLARTGALDGLAAATQAAVLRDLGPCARLSFRGRGDVLDKAGAAFGVALPREACRFAAADGRSALWLGPDEWLLLVPDGDPARIFAQVEAASAGLPHALTDVSHRSVALELSGSQAATVVNAGCPLDLDLAAFPVGMCTRTLLGRAEIVLARTAREVFHIDVWRSFAPYAWSFLDEARREYV